MSQGAEPVPVAAAAGVVRHLSRWTPRVLVVAAVLLFCALKLYSIRPLIADEHLYFQMAVLVNKGLLPYRDFFYTHPPLHLFAAVLAFRLFGYSLTVGKLLPALATLIGGLLVFAVGRRAMRAADGALACALFLLSFDPLRISSHFTGGNLAFAFAMAGLWLGYRDRPLGAGIAFGLGTLVAVYVLPGAAAVLLLLWGRSRGDALRFAAATAAVALSGNLLFYALAGYPYVYQVYLTQFLKGPEGSLVGYRLYHRLGYIVSANPLLTAGFVPGLGLLAWDARKALGNRRAREVLRRGPDGRMPLVENPQSKALLAFVAWFAAYWAFYLAISKHHAYYFIFIMPVFAWCSARAYLEIGRAIVHAVQPAPPMEPRQSRRRQRRAQAAGHGTRGAALLRAAVVIVLTLASIGVVDALYTPYAQQRYGTRVGTRHWKPNPFFPGVDRFVHAVFWQDRVDPQNPPSGITQYLQHESSYIENANQIYDAVRRHTEPGDAIFGETALVPLIASETHRRVAANLVDTSSYLFNFNLVRIEDWITAIEADHVRALVVRQGAGFMRYPAFRRYADENFKTVERVRDPLLGEVEIRLRTGG